MLEKEQVKAYLERIGYRGETRVARDTLSELIRSHLTGVPFENLEVFEEKRVPSLETEDIYKKVVENRRGGYCFELNKLFYELLTALGFSVYPVGVRIVWMKETFPPMLHRGTIAVLDGEKYFCDIGYGGPGPKGLVELIPGEYIICGDSFRVEGEDGGFFRINRMHDGEYRPMLVFRDQKMEEADFLPMNFYCAKSENVIFSQKRILNLCLPNGSVALTDDTLTIREDGGVTVIQCRDEAERRKYIKEKFGVAFEK